MLEKVFTYYKKYQEKRAVKREKEIHIMKVHSVEFHNNLKKYRPKLERIASDLNHHIYDIQDEEISLEREFILVFALRLRDLFESSLLLIGVSNYHGLFPLIRSLIESVYLLIYIQKNPQYLKEFMESKKKRGKHWSEIKKAVNDEKLDQVYNVYSDIIHINPGGFRLTSYDWKKPVEFKMITQSPLDLEKKVDDFTKIVINLMEIALRFLDEMESQIIAKQNLSHNESTSTTE